MINNNELSIHYANERRRDDLAAAERDRLAAACGASLTLARRAARPIGRALFSMGAWLLRYGKADSAHTQVYRAPAGSAKLN